MIVDAAYFKKRTEIQFLGRFYQQLVFSNIRLKHHISQLESERVLSCLYL